MVALKDYRALMNDMKLRIDDELSSFFNAKLEEANDPLTTKIIEMIRDFTMNGGKRVRPLLIVMGHDLFKKSDERVIKASISIELTQSYLLIHDDIMDQSDVRRGKPSFHIEAENRILKGVPGSKRIAENLAIVAGDLAESYSHEILFDSGLGKKEVLSASDELAKIVETTGYGQLLDIYSSISKDFAQEDLMRLHLWKTAKYTIEGPLLMGAKLSGKYENLESLSYFGLLLGVAFQLHDDVLGLFGDEKVTGKSIKNDVNEGKKTLLILKAIENSRDEDAEFIKRCLSSGDVSDEDFEALRKIVKESGSYDYSLEIMKKITEKSKEYLRSIEGDEEVKEFLLWFSDFIISRQH